MKKKLYGQWLSLINAKTGKFVGVIIAEGAQTPNQALAVANEKKLIPKPRGGIEVLGVAMLAAEDPSMPTWKLLKKKDLVGAVKAPGCVIDAAERNRIQ